MKKYIVDFGGEEEIEKAAPPTTAPKYIVVWWHEKTSAIDDCKKLISAGIPAWVVKYTFGEPILGEFGEPMKAGWGVGLNEGRIKYPLKREKGEEVCHYHLEILRSRKPPYSPFAFRRCCWMYEEIKPHLVFFEAIPCNGVPLNDVPIHPTRWAEIAKEDLERGVGAGWNIQILGSWGERWAGGGIDIGTPGIPIRKEWIVFPSLGAARAVAVAKVEEDIERNPGEWGDEFLVAFIDPNPFYDLLCEDAHDYCTEAELDLPEEFYNLDPHDPRRGEMSREAEDACVEDYVETGTMAGFKNYFRDRYGPAEYMKRLIDQLGLDYHRAADHAVAPLEETEQCINDIGTYLFSDTDVGFIELDSGAVAVEVV